MEFEQIVKRLEWLDKQQRESKDVLAALSERLAAFETTVNAASKQIKILNKQMSDAAPAAKRIEQFESLLTKQRSEIVKRIGENEKLRARSEREAAKKIQGEMAEIAKTAAQLKTALAAAETKLKERAGESQRFINNMSDLKAQVEESTRASEDALRALKLAEETHRNELKRMTDIQGELTALRKRVDESREKSVVNADNIRNIENRLAELLASEVERKQAQAAFLEKQALAQVERDRAWKEWKDKSEAFKKETEDMDAQLRQLDETMRAAKKAQETYAELNTKLERRINEVTEMQRLTEDRLRQEWLTFKADDQKRWTGYNLSSEETFRDMRKDLKRAEERVAGLNEMAQTLHDQMHQTTDTTEKQLQEMMNIVHEWMTSYQRIMGHGKKTAKK
jgi:chromosome segregation ATPase